MPKGFVYDAYEETMILEDEIEEEFVSSSASKILGSKVRQFIFSVVLVVVSFGAVDTDNVLSIVYHMNAMDYTIVLAKPMGLKTTFDHVSRDDAHKIIAAKYHGG